MKNGGRPEAVKVILEETAKKLSSAKRIEYIAMITNELLDGNARKAERVFGWGRTTVKNGIRELATEIKGIENYSARGNKKSQQMVFCPFFSALQSRPVTSL
jgi:hypothetical protein